MTKKVAHELFTHETVTVSASRTLLMPSSRPIRGRHARSGAGAGCARTSTGPMFVASMVGRHFICAVAGEKTKS